MSKHEPLVHDWREWRRRRAWYLYEQGWQQKDIAHALGASKGAVSQWVTKAKQEGTQGLRRQPRCGRPPQLSPEQRAQLPNLLAKGAEAFGFSGAVWTTERVAHMIKQQFGISYHPAHCSRLVRACNYSQQKPVEKASQRDEQRIADWKRDHWPALKKAREEGRMILFVDEAGFALLPLAVRTYAPRGQTPILRVPLTHDHLSVIGAISTDGRLFMQMQRNAYKGPDVIRFCASCCARLRGSCSSSGMEPPFIGVKRSKHSWHEEQLNAFIWNSYLAMHPSSIHRKASGTSLSGVNSRTCAVVTFGKSKMNFATPKRASDIASRFFCSVLLMPATQFSFLR